MQMSLILSSNICLVLTSNAHTSNESSFKFQLLYSRLWRDIFRLFLYISVFFSAEYKSLMPYNYNARCFYHLSTHKTNNCWVAVESGSKCMYLILYRITALCITNCGEWNRFTSCPLLYLLTSLSLSES